MAALARSASSDDNTTEALVRVSRELSDLGQRAQTLQATLSPLILAISTSETAAPQRTLFAFQELDLLTQTLFALSAHVARLGDDDAEIAGGGLAKLEARLAGHVLEGEDAGFELF